MKYSFKQLETCLIAFIADLELKLKNILPDLPVFVLQTGDGSYYLDKKFKEITEKEIYQKTPRFVINIEDIQPQKDQDTNPFNKFVYFYNGENYICSVRRSAYTIQINSDFVSPNFIYALSNLEIISSILSMENVFTYEFLGATFESSYAMSGPSLEKPTLDPSSATRNFSVKSQIELQQHLLLPRYHTIKKLSDAGYEEIKYGIIVKSEPDPDYIDSIKFLE
jgi:hypothetical protein